MLTNSSEPAAKIALFQSLFRGREDVYPIRFESRKTGRGGYAPACANEWTRGLCEKPKVKCGVCPNRRLLPVTEEVVRWHLSGKDRRGRNFVMGVYPMLQDESCHFLAMDFDGPEWRNDAAAVLQICRQQALPAALERSRSGNGAHLWFFFAEAIPARLARGEPADVVILDGGAADELGRRGVVRVDSKVELARSQVGMVVRAGAQEPDIGSVEAFRRTLLAAKSIAYSDSGSGSYLSTRLFAQLGVADQVAGKSRKVRGPPSGEPVAAVIARGEAEIGFQQVSELMHVPGVTFVGPIPAELQPGFSFAGALTSTARQPEAASALIRFLGSPEAAPVILKAGLAPIPAR